jgi:uncharacterized protein YndB with AHSA1/START domain
MLTTSRTMAAAPDAVWRVLTDLDAWPQWGPSVMGAELTGPGPLRLGSRGVVSVPFGVRLPFEVTEFDDGHAWAWRVAGVPATRHVVRGHPDGCVASFGVPLWAPAYLAVCAVALRRIESLAAA